LVCVRIFGGKTLDYLLKGLLSSKAFLMVEGMANDRLFTVADVTNWLRAGIRALDLQKGQGIFYSSPLAQPTVQDCIREDCIRE
jgi:hypothetical protein